MNFLTRIQHSLSAKLLILFLCAGSLILLLVGLVVGQGFSHQYRSSAQPIILHYVGLMQRELGSPPKLDAAQRITRNIPVDIHVFSGTRIWSTSERALDQKILDEFDFKDSDANSPYTLTRYQDELILRAQEGGYDIYFQIHDVGHFSEGNTFSLIVVVLVLGVLVLMFYATRAIFRPVVDIKQGVRQFGEGNFEHRIFKHRNDELGDLTDDVNRMASDINNMLEAKRQFLLGISHELRSPLTRCQVNLALMDESAIRDEIAREIVAMDELISELLESERLNSPHRVIRQESVEFHSLITDTIQAEFPNAKLILDLSPVTAELDIARIKLLIRNLVANALKYNGPDTAVKVSLKSAHGRVRFTVRDYGEGISSEYIPLLTEPFYRADATGRSKTGGYGLGLYLCKMIVNAHSGKLKIKSATGRGTRISCSFPLQQPRDQNADTS